MTPPPTLHVIANPAAGGRHTLRDLRAALDRRGLRYTLHSTSGPGDAARLTAQALDAGAERIAVCGGDGTVAEVAGTLAHSGVPLALLPGGSANILARELHIPRRLEAAVALLVEPGALQTVDLGWCGERPFLVRASAGFEAAIIHRTGPRLKHTWGPFGYVIGSLAALNGRMRTRFRLVLDGENHEIAAVNVFVVNACSIGRWGLRFGANVQPGDGLLDVIALDIRPASLVSMAATALHWDAGGRALRRWQARNIHIDADKPQPVHADGEALDHTPLVARVDPGAVVLMTPAAQPTAGSADR